MSRTLSRKDRILAGDKVAFPTASEQILMKHVEGGSGEMKLEQIGVPHIGEWFGTDHGQVKVTYYKLTDCLFAASIEGMGEPSTMTASMFNTMALDMNPNAIPINKPYDATIIGAACVAVSNSKNIFLPVGFSNLNKLLVFQDGNETPCSGISGVHAFVLFIGKLADNIT